MLKFWKTSALALIVCGRLLIAQDSGLLLHQDIEAEVNYSDEPLAVFQMHSCEAVNWSYSANWGDGQETPSSADHTPTHINDKGFRLRDRGSYTVWFSHVYNSAKVKPGYTVVLKDDGQCAGVYGSGGQFRHDYPIALNVWGRVPVSEVTIQNPKLKRGETLRVTIQLDSNAPASGTRVYLRVRDGVISPSVQFLVIPPGASTFQTEFVIADNAPLGRHRLGAWTAKDQEAVLPSARFEIVE